MWAALGNMLKDPRVFLSLGIWLFSVGEYVDSIKTAQAQIEKHDQRIARLENNETRISHIEQKIDDLAFYLGAPHK